MRNCFDNKVGVVETVMKAFGELFIDETKKGIKLQTMEYKKQGSHIIVDQGKNQIAGYTDIKKGLFEDVPVIIFGDHTRVIKYVDQPFFLGADGVKILRSKDKNANYKYLYYALRNANIPDTGYNRHFKWLKETKINYPSVARQDEIVRILDKLSDIIDRRKTQLQGLDSLIKARFVEMFGDININDKNWECIPLGELCSIVRGGSPRPIEQFLGGDVPWIKIGDATDGDDIYLSSTKEHIIKEGVKKSRLVKAGSLIFANCGVSLGFARIINFDGCIHDGWLAMEDIDERIDKVFLLQALNQMTEYFRTIAPSGTQPNLNTTIMKEYRQVIPPIELQKEFIRFIEQVDKSKLLSFIKLLEQLITYLYNVFIIYRQDKGEEVEDHE